MIYKGCEWFFLTSVGVWVDLASGLTFCVSLDQPILKVDQHPCVFSNEDGSSKMSDEDTLNFIRIQSGLYPENFYSDLESVDY